jgi:acetyl-CoA C-acetyltransferase
MGAARTPIGSFQGALASESAPSLGAHAIRAALGASGLADDVVNEVIMGNVISAGLKQAPARQAMRMAGLPDSCHALTVNKVCGSGMKATMLGHDLIRADSAGVVVCGGMESMTNAPYLLTKARAGQRMGHGQMFDSMFTDGLEDAETGGDVLLDTNDRMFCKRYEEIRRQEREDLQRLFRSMNLDSVSLSTHVSYTEPLLAFFRRREKRL